MTDLAPIRIVLADDHALVRDSLRTLLELEPDFAVVGAGGDGNEAVRLVRDLRPDVLLLDFAMPGMNGLDVLRTLADDGPDVRVVLLTAAIEREDTLTALQLGVRAVILKESATQSLYKCIRAVMDGQLWVGHDRIEDLVQSLRRIDQAPARDPLPAGRLTPRERDVIAGILDGLTNRDIANQFDLSEQTIKNHLLHIFDKLGVSNRLELALYAVHHRLLFDVGPKGGSSAATSQPEPLRTRSA